MTVAAAGSPAGTEVASQETSATAWPRCPPRAYTCSNTALPRGGWKGTASICFSRPLSDHEQSRNNWYRIRSCAGRTRSVVPATNVVMQLWAEQPDRGRKQHRRQPHCSLGCGPERPPALPQAREAIANADLIVLGPGGNTSATICWCRTVGTIKRSKAPGHLQSR